MKYSEIMQINLMNKGPNTRSISTDIMKQRFGYCRLDTRWIDAMNDVGFLRVI